MGDGDRAMSDHERLPCGDWSIEFNRQRDSRWVYHNCQPDVQPHKEDDEFGGYPNEDNSECLNCGVKVPLGLKNLCKLLNK